MAQVKSYIFILFLILLIIPGILFAQEKLNRFNSKGQRTGKWIIYSDSAQTKKLFEGKFKRDKTIGISKYYKPDGTLERSEKNISFKRIRTKIYHPNGKVMLAGKARIKNLPDKVHYYFYGKWTGFDTLGNAEKFVYYKKGIKVKTVYFDKNNLTNDSLIEALRRMEQNYFAANAPLIDTIRMYSIYVHKCEKIRQKLYEKDSSVFYHVDLLLKQYGYPTKAMVHEATDIPLFILSLAPYKIRERYVELLKGAATAGSIEWSSLAHYIDKIRVARGEEQLYGTQYFYTNDGKVVYYPILNPENLKARRASVGLED